VVVNRASRGVGSPGGVRSSRVLRTPRTPSVLRTPTVRGRRLVAIDGPSGVGKSTLADLIVATWRRPVALVRLDEVYPGWAGLDRGAALLAASLVGPWAAGKVARVPSWNWEAGAPGPVRTIVPGQDLVVEGCGAFDACAEASALRIWVHADDDDRRRAALTRDRGAFDPYWEMWDTQWKRHAARTEASAAGSDLIVRGLSS
jgi:hypothetical protein